MTFRRTPFTPYDTSDWTAARECNDVSYEVARERAPEAGVPLRRPTETDADYAQRFADAMELDGLDGFEPDATYAETLGLDDFDVVNDR